MLTRRAVFVWLPVLALGLLLVSSAVGLRSVPDPMATHFDARGLPDGTMARPIGLGIAPLLALVGMLILGGVTAGGRRIDDVRAVAGVGYLLLGLAWGLQLGLIASNSGASTAADARLDGTAWLSLVIVFAAFGVWAAHRCRRLEPLEPTGGCAKVDVAVDGRGDGAALTVTMRGLDRVWALRRRLRVPLSAVLEAQVFELAEVRPSGLRLPGTSVPGVLRAGSYGRSPNRDFWDVRIGPRVLVLTLADGQVYRRIVVRPREPDATLARLQRACA